MELKCFLFLALLSLHATKKGQASKELMLRDVNYNNYLKNRILVKRP